MMNRNLIHLIWLLFVITMGTGGVSIEFASATAIQSLEFQTYAQETNCLRPKSVIQCIRDRNNKLVAGVMNDFPPFGTLDADGKCCIGFDVDLINEMAKLWGIEVEFVGLADEARIPVLKGGDVDIVAAALTHTRDRDVDIDFSQNYFLDRQRLLVRKDSGINDIADLEGKRVAAILGTTGILQVDAYARNKGLNLEIVPFQIDQNALQALIDQDVAAFTTDGTALSKYAQDNFDLTVVGTPLSYEPYGIGVPSGDSNFRNLVDATLQELKENKTYDLLYSKWFSDIITSTTPYTIEILPGTRPYSLTVWTTIEPQSPVSSTIEKIKQERKLVVGVIDEFSPFGARAADGKCCIGFDIDLLKEFAKRWLGGESEATLELVEVNVSGRITKLANGDVNLVAAALTHNWEREQAIDFSQTYFRNKQSLLVQKAAGFIAVTDLQGKRIAAVQGSTSMDQIQMYAEKNQLTIEVVPFQEHSNALEALKEGSVEAFTSDKVGLLRLAQEHQDLMVLDDLPFDELYGIGVPNNDHQFRDLVNSTLQEMKLDGTYDRLYQKWFGDLPEFTSPQTIDIWPRLIYTGVIGFSQAPMVLIPTGVFTRGNHLGDTDEQPETQIELDEFYIDQYEVTNRLYRECVAAGECTPPQKLYSMKERGDYYNNVALYGNFPVIWVTWDQANAYCTFLNKRLPTEAEWEKAARGPQRFIYPWGNEWLEQVNGFRDQVDTVAVGPTLAEDYRDYDVSGYGAYDMAGNVREWVNDFYGRKYYSENQPQNPLGPAKGTSRVARGGSWSKDKKPYFWSATRREDWLPESFANDLGFRCATHKPPLELAGEK